GEERLVITRMFQDRFGTRHRVFEEPVAAAGILADGTTAGDASLLTRLLFRRSSMLWAVETALETLSDAGRHNVPREQMIGQFKKMADSFNRWYLPPEQTVGQILYQSILGNLRNLPDVQVGSPFPPADFVAQETAMLRQQRLALSESQPGMADAVRVAR